MKSEWMVRAGLGKLKAAIVAAALLAGCAGEGDDIALDEESEVSEQSASLSTGLVATSSSPTAITGSNGRSARLILSGGNASLYFASLDPSYTVSSVSLNITCRSGSTLLTKYKRFPDTLVVKAALFQLACPIGTVTRAVANFNW